MPLKGAASVGESPKQDFYSIPKGKKDEVMGYGRQKSKKRKEIKENWGCTREGHGGEAGAGVDNQKEKTRINTRERKTMSVRRILIGSPVCQKPEILKVFLESLRNLSNEKFLLDYLFVDDNQDPCSSKILGEFQREGSKVTVLPASLPGSYRCDEDTHYWDNALMLRVGEWKNRIIQYAIQQEYDFLFLADSDLVLVSGLLEHLAGLEKPVVSEIFWTSWHPGQPIEPNVWLFDEYDLARRSPGEEISEETVEERKKEFLKQLKIPGVYEVGGLGACTLISRDALLKGVDFTYIPNLTIHGEDRFFCIRAAVLGIGLYVDTAYPAYHIYRPRDLKTVPQFKKEKYDRASWLRATTEKRQRIVLSMTVRNEEGRYLERVFGGIGSYIDEAVILDDASSDRTADICETLLKEIPHKVIRNEARMFDNEFTLRRKQWEETLKAGPDWILCLDGDEVPEQAFWHQLRELVKDEQYDLYGFRLYDMWSETEYREDEYWNAHESSRLFLLRYRPEHAYTWNEIPQHCGRFPSNLEKFSRCDSSLRLQHFGWARPGDRKMKYDRYRRLDPEAVYGIQGQYDSIMDSHPHMITWREGGCNQK